MSGRWIVNKAAEIRPRPKVCCDSKPSIDYNDYGSVWECDTCRRRWYVNWLGSNIYWTAESDRQLRRRLRKEERRRQQGNGDKNIVRKGGMRPPNAPPPPTATTEIPRRPGCVPPDPTEPEWIG